MGVKALREKILNSNDIKSEKLMIEEWEVEVEIKALTGKKRAAIMTTAIDSRGKMDFEKLYAELVISSTYDIESQELIFEPTDRDMLNEKSGGVLEKIAQVVIKLSGLKPDSVETAEKN